MTLASRGPTATLHTAKARLQHFTASAGRAYAQHRNTDFGVDKRDNVSTLSPWLRHRSLLEDDVLKAVLATHSAAESAAFVQEVFWRGYFRGHLEHRPAIWARYCADCAVLQHRTDTDSALSQRLSVAMNGNTGIECFDHWAHELAATGYLHNHARMWFASIWIFTLKLPWVLGADFFLQHLLDGDPASNTCSWRWVAGLHTVGKAYNARADNIATFSDGRFEHTAGLYTDVEPLSEPPLPPAEAPALDPAATLNDGCRMGLLVVESDCQAETLALPATPCSVLTLTDPCQRALGPLADNAAQFTRDALQDASNRAAAAYALPALTDDSQDWCDALRRWVESQQLDVIAVARPPTGWVHDRLQPALAACEAAGTCVSRIVRAHDRAVWPHSAKGYFKVKKQIPKLLDELGLV